MTTLKNQNLDLRQTTSYADFLKSQDWIVERVDNINYFIKKLPVIGSVLKIQRPNAINFKTITKLQKRYRVFQTIIEAKDNKQIASIESQGYKLSKNPFLPTKTIQIDLTKPNDAIYANFTKDCRYAIRKGSSLSEIKILSSSEDVKEFHNAWKKSVNFNRYVPSLKTLLSLRKSFPQNKSLFLASHNISGSIIGGAIFTISSHDISNYITFYMYGFTNKEGRTSLSQYSLLYSGILWGKKMNCKLFDFEGIYDERFPNRSWLGFTHFKKQFGGTEVLYPGCYTKFRLPYFTKSCIIHPR